MGLHRELLDAGQLKEKMDSLRDRKGDLNRKIADAKKSGGDTDELIANQKAVSSEIKVLQKALKKQLNAGGEPKRWAPEAPRAPSPILDKDRVGPIEVVDAFHRKDSLADADEYVRAHPAGSIWHTTGISQFIENTYGHRSRYLCALDANRGVVGVLPLVQMKSRIFGNFVVSVPYFNYGGVLADHRAIADALFERAIAWRDEIGAGHLEMRHCFNIGFHFPQRTDKVTFWLPLPESSEDLWSSFPPKVRAQIRRGERETEEVAFGGKELLDQFYRVFARNMRDLGTPVYGKEFFANLLNELGSSANLVVIRKNSQPIGCAFIAGQGARLEIPWASTLREYNHTGINMLMYWKVLEYAIQNKYQIFDFGRCTKGAGTSRFKRQWGASELPLFWDYALPEGGDLPALNPENPKFRLMIAIWKRMPVWISRLIGPPIVKNLP
jgi:FemAB-related protein (PEP-CTERM system-associated)